MEATPHTENRCAYSGRIPAQTLLCSVCEHLFDEEIMVCVMGANQGGPFTCPLCTGVNVPLMHNVDIRNVVYNEGRNEGAPNGVELESQVEDILYVSVPEIDKLVEPVDVNILCKFVNKCNRKNGYMTLKSKELLESLQFKELYQKYNKRVLGKNKFEIYSPGNLSDCRGTAVETVLAIHNKKVLVKWKDLDHTHSTWESIDDPIRWDQDLVMRFFTVHAISRR
jgi:hypothetical protein